MLDERTITEKVQVKCQIEGKIGKREGRGSAPVPTTVYPSARRVEMMCVARKPEAPVTRILAGAATPGIFSESQVEGRGKEDEFEQSEAWRLVFIRSRIPLCINYLFTVRVGVDDVRISTRAEGL